jgi:acetamidase/formamidase
MGAPIIPREAVICRAIEPATRPEVNRACGLARRARCVTMSRLATGGKNMSWLETSIMARKGVAGGRPGDGHRLTEAEQGSYHFVYGPYASPVLKVKPGAVITVETVDAFGGVITSEQDKPTEKLVFPFLNPQNGPIFVEGAEKGDALAVHIISVLPRGPQPAGTTALIPEFGGLVGTAATALLNKPLPERVKKMEVTPEGGIKFSDRIILPYEPFIGTIGTSPQIEAISSLQPDSHGGNMDLPDVGPGSVVYLPVNTTGAYLYLGDCHGTQGDGELCGVAVEIPAVVTIQVDLIKGWTLAWPRLETEKFIMTIGSARPMEDAARIAYRELTRWLAAEYGFEELDAYLLLTQAGRVRLGNMVDPKYTLGASILKKYLP